MGFRDSASYELATIWALDEATPMVLSEDFRHIWLNLNADNTAVYTLTVYASDQEDRPDLTAAVSATNDFSVVQVINKANWSSIDGGTWIGITTDGFTRYEINDNAARWVWVKITAYTTGDATIRIALDDNQ